MKKRASQEEQTQQPQGPHVQPSVKRLSFGNHAPEHEEKP